jgi:type I restriction enzyme S subunit
VIKFTTVEDVCDIVTDGTHYTPKNVGSGIPFLTVKDVTDFELDFTNCSLISEVDYQTAKLGNSAPQKGDVLFSKDGTVGKVHVVATDKPFAVLSSLAILRPKTQLIEARYLGYALRSPFVLEDALKRKTGSAIRRIILSDLKRVRLPLPPLEEQRRIAEILDRAEELRSKRREAIAQLDTLTQAIFLEMFGDPATNPKGWAVQPVSKYVAEFQGGKSIESESGENILTINRILKVSAVTGMKFLAHESKPVPDSYTPPLAHFVRPGDLLFSRANTTELVGAVAYVESTPSNLLLPDKLWRFVWQKPPMTEPLFVWALFQTPAIRYEISRRATGTSGSMKNISQQKVFGITTIIPPLSIQKEFAHRVEAVEKLKASHRASLSELDALFASLQHRAFRGEL